MSYLRQTVSWLSTRAARLEPRVVAGRVCAQPLLGRAAMSGIRHFSSTSYLQLRGEGDGSHIEPPHPKEAGQQPMTSSGTRYLGSKATPVACAYWDVFSLPFLT